MIALQRHIPNAYDESADTGLPYVMDKSRKQLEPVNLSWEALGRLPKGISDRIAPASKQPPGSKLGPQSRTTYEPGGGNPHSIPLLPKLAGDF